MRILIVDDHEIVRKGIRTLLSAERYVVLGEAADGEEAIEKAEELKPDVILMDVSMPRLNGLEATRRITGTVPKASVIIVSQHESSELLRQAVAAGAKGYVTKSELGKELIAALSAIEKGEDFFLKSML